MYPIEPYGRLVHRASLFGGPIFYEFAIAGIGLAAGGTLYAFITRLVASKENHTVKLGGISDAKAQTTTEGFLDPDAAIPTHIGIAKEITDDFDLDEYLNIDEIINK